MTVVKSFNKVTCEQFRRELNQVLAKFGQETGLVLNIGTIRFAVDGSSLRTQLSANVKAGLSDESIALGQSAALVKALKAFGIADRFVSPTNGEITLVDYRPRSHKYPFIGKTRAGKMFKFSASHIKAYQKV